MASRTNRQKAQTRMTSLQSKFHALALQLKGMFWERDAIVSGMLCAAVAGEHVLLLGQPGTAKSMLVRQFCAGFGGQYFEWLLSKYSVPEELFGPLSLVELKRGIYSRVTTGKLPEAEIAFLDEIFKANSGVLNSLLSAINERVFHDGNSAKRIPLRMCVGASNELPDGPELAALYDRFLLRYWVSPIADRKAQAAMLLAPVKQTSLCATLEDWEAAQVEAEQVLVPAQVIDELLTLKTKLAAAGIMVSDRRWKRSVGLLRANAWLSEDDEVSTDHFAILSDVLWSDPATRATVASAVDEVSGSSALVARKVLDTLLVARQGIPSKPDRGDQTAFRAYQQQLVALSSEASEALRKLQAEQAKTTGKKRKKVEEVLAEVQQVKVSINQLVREGLEI